MQTKQTLQEKLGNMIILYYLSASYTAWKVSEFRDILVHISRIWTEYLSVFSPNAGKCGPE